MRHDIALLALAALLLGGGCSKKAPEQTAMRPATGTRPAAPAPATAEEVREKWGIEPIGPLRSAGGYMLDFRFRVHDPAKARPMLVSRVARYLVHPASGMKAYVPSSPKIGPLRQTSEMPQRGRIYFIMFANPGARIQRGDKVTVVIGDCILQNLTVQ